MNVTISEDRWRHGRHLAGPAIYAYIALIIATLWLPEPPRIVGLLMLGGLVGIVFAGMKHDRELCERCMARMPLDSDAAVRRNRPILKARHHSWWILGTVIGLLVIQDLFPAHSWKSGAVATLGNVVIALFFFVVDRHNRLQPWCPWCRGGGDDEALVPDTPPGDRIPTPSA